MSHSSPPPQYVDNGSSLPEVVAPGQHPYADAPQVINSGAHNAPEFHYQYSGQYHQQLQRHHQQQYFDQSPEAVPVVDEYKGNAIAGAGAAAHEVNGDGVAPAGAEGAKAVPFWRSKRVLLIAGGVLVAIIVAAVVGGVVGSQKAKSGVELSSSSSSTPPGTQTAQPPSSATGTSSSVPSATPVLMRPGTVAGTSIASGVFAQGIQVFWQDDVTSQISYSVYNNGGDYGPLTKLDLSQPPTGNTSLAATSWFVDNNVTNNAIVQLYYLIETDSQTGRVNIAMADLICTHNQTCTEQDTVILTSNVTFTEVNPFTDIAAVWRRDPSIKYNNRVYFQAKDTGNMIELSGDTATTTGWAPKDLGVQAQNGSSLTAVFAPGYTMELYFFDANNTLSQLVNTDHWADPTEINVDPHEGAGGSGTVEACWEPQANLFMIYYVDNKGDIMEYLRDGIGTNWDGGMSPTSQTADQTITCAAWDSTVRLYYMENEAMTRGTRGTTSWTIDLLSSV